MPDRRFRATNPVATNPAIQEVIAGLLHVAVQIPVEEACSAYELFLVRLPLLIGHTGVKLHGSQKSAAKGDRQEQQDWAEQAAVFYQFDKPTIWTCKKRRLTPLSNININEGHAACRAQNHGGMSN